MSFQTARAIGRQYEEAMVGQVQELGLGKVRLIEVGGCERSELVQECERVFGKGSDESSNPVSEGLQDIPSERRKQIFRNLRKIHNATGRCSNQYLRASLKKRGAPKEVLRCVDYFKCDVCDERRRPDPRSQSTLYELVPKWHTLQCDVFFVEPS